MRHPRITLQKPDLRFQRALSVSGLHSSRHWHKLDPGRSTRQEQVVLAFRIEQSRSSFAFTHLSRDHRASYAPARTESPTTAHAARLAPGARGGTARPRDAVRPGALAAPSRPRHVPVSGGQGARARARRRPSVAQRRPHLRRDPSGCRAGRPPTACHRPARRPAAGWAGPGRAARGTRLGAAGTGATPYRAPGRRRGTGLRAEGLLPGTRDGLETAPSFLPSGRHAPLARTDPRLGGRRRVHPLNEDLRAAAAAGVSVAAARAPDAAGARLENISGLGRSLTTASLLPDSVLRDWLRREHVTRATT